MHIQDVHPYRTFVRVLIAARVPECLLVRGACEVVFESFVIFSPQQVKSTAAATQRQLQSRIKQLHLMLSDVEFRQGLLCLLPPFGRWVVRTVWRTTDIILTRSKAQRFFWSPRGEGWDRMGSSAGPPPPWGSPRALRARHCSRNF